MKDSRKKMEDEIRKIEEERRLKDTQSLDDNQIKKQPIRKELSESSRSVFGSVEAERGLGIDEYAEKEAPTHFHVKEGKGFLSKLLGKKRVKRPKEDEPIELISRKEKQINIFGKKIRFKKKTFVIISLNFLLVSAIMTINYLMLRDVSSLFTTISIISAFIFVFPLILIKYGEFKKQKEIEDMFPVFLREFVEATRGGMTLPHAMRSLTVNDYKSLTPYVKQMSAQLNWGIPVDRVLMGFGRKTKSRLIMRIISSVIESHRFGGNLSDTFEALSHTAIEIDKLREERRLYMNSQLMTGYIVFFVFLAVMIGLQKFLVPSLAEVSAGGLFGEGPVRKSNVDLGKEYGTLFRNLILIQGMFAGISIGKMAEGSMVAGMKHSLFMMFVGFLVFTLAV